MARFFFNLQQGAEYVKDTEGEELPDSNEIQKEALLAARDVFSEGAFSGEDRGDWSFNVTDEDGQTVLIFPFADALKEAKL